MKRFIGLFIMLIGLISFTATTSQAQLTPVIMTKGVAGDSAIINTSTPQVTTTVLESRAVVTIQVVVHKNSGTVAGKCECQGSLDGTNFVRIKGVGVGNSTVAGTDTLALTNVTDQSYIWTIKPSSYYSYRVKCTGVGTMNAKITGYLLRRKNE